MSSDFRKKLREALYDKRLELFNEWLGLPIKALSGFSYPSFVEYIDCLQCGYIGLWIACKDYDPGIAKFSTFAYFRIKQEIFHYIRNQYKLQGKGRNNTDRGGKYHEYDTYSYDALEWFEVVDKDAENYVSKALDTIVIDDLLQCLSYKQRKIVRKYYGIGCDPVSQYEIAKVIGKSQMHICRNLTKAKKILKQKITRIRRLGGEV